MVELGGASPKSTPDVTILSDEDAQRGIVAND
jgi:hypothetical protein